MLKKTIQRIAILFVFIYPLIYIKGFPFPGIFPRAIFTFFVCELLVFLFLLFSLSKREIVLKKSHLWVSLAAYIGVLFVSAVSGSDFGQSFWSNPSRMTGIVTWLHYLGLFLVLSAVLDRAGWRNIFRSVLLSGLALALGSFVGVDGFNLFNYAFIKEGGSFFGNTSYSGAYYLLVFLLSIIGFALESGKVWKRIYIFGAAAMFFNPDLFNFSLFSGEVGLGDAFRDPALFLGMARASALVLLASIIILSLIFLMHKLAVRKNVIAVATSILIFISGLYAYGFTSLIGQEGKIYDAYLAESGSARPLVWGMAVEGIKDRPILGYGPENFNYVYQEHLDPKIISLENGIEWFDSAHNFTLAQFLDAGIIGAMALFVIFLLIIFKSFAMYSHRGDFYLLVIPFVFAFHFLQMQTFFQTDSALFLTFLLLSFIVSHEKDLFLKVPRYLLGIWPKAMLTVALAASAYLFIYVPAKESLLISRIAMAEEKGVRIALLHELNSLKAYPEEALRLLSSQFIDATAPRVADFKKAGLIGSVGEEYEIYISAYEKYLAEQGNSYRYLLDNANIINSAFIFDIDELKKGEELLKRAINISDRYPRPYWLLAINLYYQGKNDEALEYAKIAYNLDPAIRQSGEIVDFIKRQSVKPQIGREYIYISNTY